MCLTDLPYACPAEANLPRFAYLLLTPLEDKLQAMIDRLFGNLDARFPSRQPRRDYRSGVSFAEEGHTRYMLKFPARICRVGRTIAGFKMKTGGRFQPPVSGVRRKCRGSVRGALPAVRTARAVCFID